MIWFRSVWLAPLFLIAGLNASAHDNRAADPSCEAYLTPAQRLKLRDALEKTPALRSYIIEMSEDPEVSAYVKKLLKRTLSDANIELVDLTEELRREWKIPDWWSAFAEHAESPATWGYPEDPTSHEILGYYEHKFSTEHGIAFSDDDTPEALLGLIHELAHVRFNEFLLKNYDRICRRFPSSFAKYINGQCYLNTEFVRLLDEKFAYETQWRVLGKVHAPYFRNRLHYSHETLVTRSQSFIRAYVGRWLVDEADNYQINAPHIAIFAERPISRILLADERVMAVDEAVKLVVNNPGVEKPRGIDFHVALSLVLQLREARGFPKTINSPLHAASLLKTLIDLPGGLRRANRLLAGLVLYAAPYSETRERLNEIFRGPAFSKELRRLHWRKYGDQFINWSDLQTFRDRLNADQSE